MRALFVAGMGRDRRDTYIGSRDAGVLGEDDKSQASLSLIEVPARPSAERRTQLGVAGTERTDRRRRSDVLVE
jgi:hypothetical protein